MVNLEDGLDVRTVGVVEQVRQLDEGVAQRLAGSDAPLLVHRQHALQQIDELAPVHLLSQQLATLQFCWHVHLNQHQKIDPSNSARQ